MKKALLEWLTDLLRPWFVPLEDYQHVQYVCWGAEAYIRRLNETQLELLNEIYSRDLQTYEKLGASTEFKTTTYTQHDTREEVYQVAMRVPHIRFISLRDPTRIHRDVIEFSVARLTTAFVKHIRSQLFKI